MQLSQENLAEINQQLEGKSPAEIVAWALSVDGKAVLTTNFNPHEAAILHMVASQDASIDVLCIDHGYNTDATYKFAEGLIDRLSLNMHYYTPKVTTARRAATMGGIPSIDDEAAHDAFTQEVKIEPFKRAMKEHAPVIWFTALRKDQTAHREGMPVVAWDSAFNCYKVCPVLELSELDVEEYLYENDLPMEEDYNDPTKVLKHRECGLHLAK